jgi:hypothetical protein
VPRRVSSNQLTDGIDGERGNKRWLSAEAVAHPATEKPTDKHPHEDRAAQQLCVAKTRSVRHSLALHLMASSMSGLPFPDVVNGAPFASASRFKSGTTSRIIVKTPQDKR